LLSPVAATERLDATEKTEEGKASGWNFHYLISGEVNLPTGSRTVWDGDLPIVPEPATWISGAVLAGLLGVSLFRRKQDRLEEAK
jgi:hypothetical protein